MEKSATLHYINLAFMPRDCDVAPKQNTLFSLPQNSPPLDPIEKS